MPAVWLLRRMSKVHKMYGRGGYLFHEEFVEIFVPLIHEEAPWTFYMWYEGCSLISALCLISFTVRSRWQCALYEMKVDFFPVDWYQPLLQGCLETLQSNTAHSYHIPVFLQLINKHFWPHVKEVLKTFSTNLIFLCFGNNCISVIVQAENNLHLFLKLDIGFPFITSLICKYTSNTIDAKKKSPSKIFLISIVNCTVNALHLRLSKV